MALREVSLECKTAKQRKKIEAKVTGTINLGLFKISFSGEFGYETEEESHEYDVKFRCKTRGGDSEMLRCDLQQGSLQNLWDQLDVTWNKFFKSVDLQNAAVIMAEAQPINGALVKTFNLTDAEQDLLSARISFARQRIDELNAMMSTLDIKMKSIKSYLASAELRLAPAMQASMSEDYESAVDTFKDLHVRPMIDELREYLCNDTLTLLKVRPPVGLENRSGCNLDDKNSDCYKVRGGLHYTEMTQLHRLLLKGDKRWFPVVDGHWAVWFGPLAYGNRAP
jgi:hypothetical protein